MESNQHTITIIQSSKQGELNKTYSPLQNLSIGDSLGSFITSGITYDLKNFVDIETQLSYDDSINLILNNNSESPRIINTQFRTLGNNRYEYLTRNQSVATNIYDETTIKSSTDLFLRSNKWPIIDLIRVGGNGQLMGGNYVFYIKYCDEDFNETEIVSESGIISIVHGDIPSNINGTLVDERTNKSIVLHIDNIDENFNKFFLYFSRDTSDLNGISLTKYYKFNDPCSVSSDGYLTITGYENITEISQDLLSVKYNYFSAAKTHAITQNILFFGNVQSSERDYAKLQQETYKIGVTLKQKEESIGYVSSDYSSNLNVYNEYYNPKNIYYYLGYWPDEYYALGISYILQDGTVTNSFALRGGEFKALNECLSYDIEPTTKYEVNTIINDVSFENTGGIFKLPKIEIINHTEKKVCPLYFEFSFPENVLKSLKDLGVVGYFFTRTKRTPTSLFQGLSVGIDRESGIPMPYVTNGIKTGFVAESFLNDNRILSNDVDKHLRSTEYLNNSALLSLDSMINPLMQSILSWNEYELTEEYDCTIESSSKNRHYNITLYTPIKNSVLTSLVYIDKDIPSFYIDKWYFSTRAGAAESVREFENFNSRDLSEESKDLLRGVYCPIIGSNKLLSKSSIYTVKNKIENPLEWIKTLVNTNNQYYAITNRYRLDDTSVDTRITAFRGDCFTNTVTIRINRNFIDPTVPSNDIIIDEKTWQNNYKGFNTMSSDEGSKNSWTNINLADVNSVPLGIWITFKCLSNYNLGFRSLDSSNIDLINKLGSKGSFYPISGINDKSGGKVPESQLLNAGYSITLPRTEYYKWQPTPYENWNFENRIAFSNVASTKMFTNGFRVFQGLAYQDVDKQFGQIIKLFPYGKNLLCVFEHGLAEVPINEKALLSTQEGLSIHLYGAGVLQEQVAVISPDYGSTWMESLIKTPNAYYGVDTSAKKIWKFNNTEGFTCISDFKIQSFLNEELTIDWNDKFFMGATNVRTHYNNFKGDVIFTFYKDDKAYSLCYNELTKVWVSRYTWIPLLSANIDNHMYSFDRNSIAEYSNICKQCLKTEGITCEIPFYDDLTEKVIFKYVGFLPCKLKVSNYELDVDLDEDYLQRLTSKIKIREDKNNTWILHIPIELIDAKSKVTIEAIYDAKNTVIETSTFIIGRKNRFNNVLSLYEHATDSPITNWYENQEPFEYEFVVNQPIGMHKIFNDLVIISNNAEPNSIEVEVIGDVYDFKDAWKNTEIDYINTLNVTKDKVYTTSLKYNKVNDEYSFLMHQDCINIVSMGRRIGNISYIEGKWHAVLQPIYYNNKTSRLRDKWAKIRIKYSGEKLAIITAIQTLMNISY